MEFNETFYKLETSDGKEIVAEAWANGIRYFKVQDGKSTAIREARKTPHRCTEIVSEDAFKTTRLIRAADDRITSLEARIAQLENKLDNKLDEDK